MTNLALPERKMGILLAVFAIPLLFLPKVSILSVQGETAGLRIDDFVLLFLSGFILLQRFFREQGILKFEWTVVLIFLASLASFFVNTTFFLLDLPAPTVPKILYAFRFLEYFLFFYIGYYASRIVNLSNILLLFLGLNGLLLFGQKFGLVGGFSHEGYSAHAAHRTQGISSFPAEMGLMLNMLFCYFIYYYAKIPLLSRIHAPTLKKLWGRWRIYALGAIFLVLILFTGARIALLSFLLTYCLVMFQQKKKHFLGPALMLVLLLFAGAFFAAKTKSISERTTIFSMENLTLIRDVWEKTDLETTKPHERVVELDRYNVDVSWWMRLQNWLYFSKFYLSSPRFWLLGLGPGTTGSALDGSILRIIVEGGIVGGVLFFIFFFRIYRENPALKLMTLNYALNMVFFDAHIAYKSMSLLFFISGYAMSQRSQPAVSACWELSALSFKKPRISAGGA